MHIDIAIRVSMANQCKNILIHNLKDNFVIVLIYDFSYL